MKFYVSTQIRENYGAHDWDGSGSCPQRWKCKGGSTYVVENLSIADAIEMAQAPEAILAFIQNKDEYIQESAIDFGLLDDCAPLPMDDWEAPVVMVWDADARCYHCSSVEEFGGTSQPIKRYWDLLLGGETNNRRYETLSEEDIAAFRSSNQRHTGSGIAA